jgi:hypothetical protein
MIIFFQSNTQNCRVNVEKQNVIIDSLEKYKQILVDCSTFEDKEIKEYSHAIYGDDIDNTTTTVCF